MSSRHSISIAVFSENEDDVALINSTLRDGGLAADCHWVEKPDDIGAVLADKDVELLVLNCDRFSLSVRQVIKQKDRHNPEIPVIGLKEQADEAAIQQAMDEGACDLVSLSNKARLKAVVSRELRAMRVERALNSTIFSVSEYKKQLNDYMQASPDAIALVEDGIITDVNEAWLELFRAASSEEIVGLPVMDSFESESHAAIKGALVATIAGKWDVDESLLAKSHVATDDDSEVHLQFRKYVFDNGPCVQVRIAKMDKASQEPTKLVHDALKRDPTTLLFHRAQLVERITGRLAKKPKSGLHALAYVKIDSFSKVAEQVGILNSDEVLAQFAEALRKRLHPRDVAGRFEGTGLLVLLERGSARDAEVWGKQLCEHICRQTFEVEDRSAQLTCTVGVCPASEVYASLEEFVAATVDAYKLGKEAGGDTVFLSEAAQKDTKRQEYDAIWLKHLKAALMEDRFRLAQLPIAGLRSDSVEMYDLVVRMVDESGNSILPSEFLPAAERNNMMKNIDRWMVKAAIDFCEESDADRVFVRLSRQSVLDATTVGWMDQEFEKHKFDCSRLVAQIPECDAARHIKQTRELVGKFRRMGIGFAIEHYGVDQARFQILEILKPDYIKIDGEVMHTLMADTTLQRSVEKIVRAAREHKIKTIAERVENANSMAVLFQLGLDYMQGHYVHEPEVVLEDADSGTRNTLESLTAVTAAS